MTDIAAMNPLNDLFRRLRSSIGWVAAQFWAGLLLILAGIAWTRLPDKYSWQVIVTLLLPLVLIALALLLHAGTMRKLLNIEERRVRFFLGALSLLVWVAIIWVAWALLDWCDDRIPIWAGYLNSKAPAHARATFLTYEHLQNWFTILEWVLRWIVVPAKVIPHAIASAQWGWRMPWRKLICLLLNWRWWLAAVVAALLAVAWPSHFFTGEPNGTVSHQVWTVILKLAGAYLLAVACWVLLLAWAVVLMTRSEHSAEQPGDDALHLVPVGSGPLGEDSVKLPLPEGGDDVVGNA